MTETIIEESPRPLEPGDHTCGGYGPEPCLACLAKMRTTGQKEYDEVSNHPTRYNAHPSGVECIDIIEHMPFNVGSAVKYLWRLGLKENATDIQDLKKALWYVEREIKLRSPKPDDSLLIEMAKNAMKFYFATCAHCNKCFFRLNGGPCCRCGKRSQ